MTTATKTTFPAQSTAARCNIEIGDWIVAGSTLDDLDIGRIGEISPDGENAMVAWSSGDRTPCPLCGADVLVYGDGSTANDVYQTRRVRFAAVDYVPHDDYDDCD